MTLSRALLTTDHDAIGRRYLACGAAFAVFGGLEALLMRWQLACPGRPIPFVGEWILPGSGGVIGPAEYAQLFTTHGLVMIFFAMTPILIGWLSHSILPIQIGAREMALPQISRLAFWAFAIAQALVLASFLVPGGTASAGWTSYPPLSALVGSPSLGQSVLALALIAAGISAILSGINVIVTIITRREPGLSFLEMPQLAWSLWLASVLNVLFVPILAAAMLLLLCDRHLGTTFFIVPGDPLVYQQLFWIFGHPEVYVLILPAWGIIGQMLTAFASLRASSHRGIVAGFIGVAALSGFVYGHHLYTAGLSPMLGLAFSFLTLLIGVPSIIIVLHWLHALMAGPVRLEAPMLYALFAMIVFGLGGLTGIPLGAITSDLWLHDTAYVVGHFHLTMAAATLLTAFAAITHWFPQISGRRLDERLAKAHAIATFGALVLAFGGMLVAGYLGQHRRLWDPGAHQAGAELGGLNAFIGGCVVALALAQGLLVWNVARSWRRGERVGAEPSCVSGSSLSRETTIPRNRPR